MIIVAMRVAALAALAVLTLGTAGADARQSRCLPVMPSDRAPSWSPDGRGVAFIRREGDCIHTWGVYVAWLDRPTPQRLASGGGGGDYPAAWSPDGTRLGFPSKGWLTVVTVRGRGLDQLARGGEAPAWSPDGRRIAFTFGRQLRVIGADGSDERVLATGASKAEPAWSPSGAELLYGGDDGEIHVIDVESGADRIVAGGEDPIWAGTSGAILFISTHSGSHQLWRLAPDGRLSQETFEPGRSFDPVSNRDGSAVTFARVYDADRRVEIHYWSREGRHRFPANDTVGVQTAISPDGSSIAWPARSRCGRLGIHLRTPAARPRSDRRLTNGCEFRGTSGRDTIRGTPWNDVIDAGAGNDVVLTRDSYRDSVRCGPGRDRVDADRKDAIARDCERVQRP